MRLIPLLLMACGQPGPAPERQCWDEPYTYPPPGEYVVGLYSDEMGYDAGPETGLIDPTAHIDSDKLIIEYTNHLGQRVEVTYLISPEGEGLKD